MWADIGVCIRCDIASGVEATNAFANRMVFFNWWSHSRGRVGVEVGSGYRFARLDTVAATTRCSPLLSQTDSTMLTPMEPRLVYEVFAHFNGVFVGRPSVVLFVG